MLINNLILELNSVCNNRCVYCYLPGHTATGAGTERYFKRQLKKYSTHHIANADFTGGEPTLYPKLAELIAYARELGYNNRTLVTNGRRLSDREFLQTLIDAGLTRVVISFDGHDRRLVARITGAAQAFREVAQAMRAIRRLPKKIELGVTIVVNALNYTSIPATVKAAYQRGAEFINIQFLLPFVKDETVRSRKLLVGVSVPYASSVPYVQKTLDQFGKKVKINVHFIPYCLMKGYERFLQMESLKYDRAIVHYAGFMYNIGEHLKKGCIKPRSCSRCRYEDRCMGFMQPIA